MKLHLANSRNGYTLTGYGAGFLAVNGTRYEHALIVTPEDAPVLWPVESVAALDAEIAGLRA